MNITVIAMVVTSHRTITVFGVVQTRIGCEILIARLD